MTNTKTISFILSFLIPCVLGVGILVMKNQVQGLEKELITLNKSIQDDIKTIHVLKAEWSHLNNPARLRKLAEKHILLKPIQAEQIINLSALPFEYESDENRRILAQQNIANYADQNKNLKKLVNARR